MAMATALPPFTILRDKLELWQRQSTQDSVEMRDYHRRAAAELSGVLKLVEDMRDALIDCEEYFANRADADCEGDPLEFVPNKEMRLLNTVQAVLSTASATPGGQ